MSPKALFDYLAAPRHPSPWDKAALVLIDYQLEYVSGSLPLPGVEAAIAEATRLLARARREKAPVFHVVHHARPGAPLFDPAAPQSRIVPRLEPASGEPVVVKGHPSAFAGTGLDWSIRATGRDELILAGFMTHMCVSATAREAASLGYRVTIVASATAARDLPNPLGGVSRAEEVQRTALAELADFVAVVVRDSDAWPGP